MDLRDSSGHAWVWRQLERDAEGRRRGFPDGYMVLEEQRPHLAPDRPARNAPCPCGSGAKFKHCCLELVATAQRSRLWPRLTVGVFLVAATLALLNLLLP